jgi:hypothetical protein
MMKATLIEQDITNRSGSWRSIVATFMARDYRGSFMNLHTIQLAILDTYQHRLKNPSLF